MRDTIFFRVASWVTFFFSCYSWWLLYNQGTLWWIALGLLLLISLFTMIMGLNAVKRMFYMPSIQYPIFRVIIAATAVGYFLSAFLGCIHIFSQSPVNDKSVIIFPLIISAFIFAGSTFGLFLADD